MKVSEAQLGSLRPETWRHLLVIPSEHRGPVPNELPANLFSESSDLFPADLTEDAHGVVALLAFTKCVPRLSDKHDWYFVSHQSGGYACHHPLFVGTPLALRPGIRKALEGLATRYFEASGGHFYRGSVLATDLFEYVNELKQLGLHCESSYPLLEEGVYPIDATQEHLDLICVAPPILAEIADGFSSAYGLTVAVLTENSD